MSHESKKGPSFQDLVDAQRMIKDPAAAKAKEVETIVAAIYPEVDQLLRARLETDKRFQDVERFLQDETLKEAVKALTDKINGACRQRWGGVFSVSSEAADQPYDIYSWLHHPYPSHSDWEKKVREYMLEQVKKGITSADDVTDGIVGRWLENAAAISTIFYDHRLPINKGKSERKRIDEPYKLCVDFGFSKKGVPQYSCSMISYGRPFFERREDLLSCLVEQYLADLPEPFYPHQLENWRSQVKTPGFDLVKTKLKALGQDLPIQDYGFLVLTDLKQRVEALISLANLEIEKIERLRNIDKSTTEIARNTREISANTYSTAQDAYTISRAINGLSLNVGNIAAKIEEMSRAVDEVSRQLGSRT